MVKEDSTEDDPGGIASLVVHNSILVDNESYPAHVAGQILIDVIDDLAEASYAGTYIVDDTNNPEIVIDDLLFGFYGFHPKLIRSLYESSVFSPLDMDYYDDGAESVDIELDERGEGESVTLNYLYLVNLFGLNSESVKLFELRYLPTDHLSMLLWQKRGEIIRYTEQD